jgi:hypothetical protein
MAGGLLDEDFFTPLPFNTGLEYSPLRRVFMNPRAQGCTGIPTRPETRGKVDTSLCKHICETVTEGVHSEHTANEEDYA